MKLSEFDYALPKELIAQHPLKERDMARLLVVDRKTCGFAHRYFKDIGEYLHKGDLLVLNDTKVLPSRLTGRRVSGGRVEVLLLSRKNGMIFNALIRPARVKPGEKINFNGNSIYCTRTAKNEVTFTAPDIEAVYKLGAMPLPPYIKRPAQDSDNLYYQTVYAKNPGSVASPTAGLHFTPELLAALSAAGVNIAYVTLHVGYATFKPVKAGDIRGHKMENEYFCIPDQALGLIKKTRSNAGRIIACGTTSCRVLETYARLAKQEGETDLFIYPGYEFKMTDCLLTNFHLPRTTLFMLARAFGQDEAVKSAYREAIDQKYRFYSYGDAMLII